MTLAVSTLGAQIALVFFLTLFLTVIIWLWLTPKKRWNKDARIPLDEVPQVYDEADPTSPQARNRRHD